MLCFRLNSCIRVSDCVWACRSGCSGLPLQSEFLVLRNYLLLGQIHFWASPWVRRILHLTPMVNNRMAISCKTPQLVSFEFIIPAWRVLIIIIYSRSWVIIQYFYNTINTYFYMHIIYDEWIWLLGLNLFRWHWNHPFDLFDLGQRRM